MDLRMARVGGAGSSVEFEATPWYPPRVHKSRNAILLACLLSLGFACKEKPEDKTPKQGANAEAPANAEEPAEKPVQRSGLPLIKIMLVAEDPVGASARDLTSLRPEPIAGAALQELREAHQKAAQELEGEEAALDTRGPRVVAMVRFAEPRIAAKVGEQNPARFDLGYAIGAAERFLDEAEYCLAHGTCECAHGLEELAKMLAAAGDELGASSVESLDAARQDLGGLRSRIQMLPQHPDKKEQGRSDAVAKAVVAVDALSELTDRRFEAMSSAEVQAWGQPVTPARSGTKLGKLPDSLGAEELARRLKVEEGIIEPTDRLFEALMAGVGRLEALAKEKKLRRKPPRRGAGSPVDVARCEELAMPISEWGKTAKKSKVAIDCKAIARKYGGAPATDAELALHILDWGVLEPTRRTIRKDTELPVALIKGDIMPTSQLDAAAIAISLAIGRKPPLERAVQRALGDACLSAVALWVHGELGTESELSKELSGHCVSKTPRAWIVEATSRPRRALAGLGFVISGRQGVATMNRFWWTPLGAPRIMRDSLTGAESVAPPTPLAPVPPPESTAPDPPDESTAPDPAE
jgi:hypothetical protein